jgi:Fic family protein
MSERDILGEVNAAYLRTLDAKKGVPESAPEGYGTVPELAMMRGVSERTMRMAVQRARKIGWLKRLEVRDARSDGRTYLKTVYKIERPAEPDAGGKRRK